MQLKMAHKPLVLLDKVVIPGESKILDLNIATLHTMTEMKVPIIVSRSIYEGPTVLLIAGLHGDELIGMEIVRQIIARKINEPNIGTIICMPLVNVFGFVNQERDFPDGRDLNRVFPGSLNGSLASRYAYHIMNEIVPVVDYVIDYHSGGRGRNNAPQIRIEANNPVLDEMAEAFHPPYVLYSSNIEGSFREACDKLGKNYLLYEGGKSLDLPKYEIEVGIEGTMRFLNYLNMLNKRYEVPYSTEPIVYVENSVWMRASISGLMHPIIKHGSKVKEGDLLCKISDPFGFKEEDVLAPHDGYIICDNENPIVFQGDAIYRISTKII